MPDTLIVAAVDAIRDRADAAMRKVAEREFALNEDYNRRDHRAVAAIYHRGELKARKARALCDSVSIRAGAGDSAAAYRLLRYVLTAVSNPLPLP